MTLRTLDLFCGCGGFSRGFADIPEIKMIAGIDFWEKAIETYTKNNNHLGLCKDLTKFSPAEFSESTNSLTLKELQRIQTFPEDFEFCGSKKDVTIQIGNAVPCKFAYHLGQYIVEKLKMKKN